MDELNLQVTNAIVEVERLEAEVKKLSGSPSLGCLKVVQAYLKLASAEAHLAEVHPLTSIEGDIARRGMVNAALKAVSYMSDSVILSAQGASE